MSNKEKTFRDTKKIENLPTFRKFYRKPHLEELGDLRTLTLGGSPGVGDSGGGAGSEFPLGSSPGSPFFLPPE